ncbi:EcsC family protein [Halobacillus sp. ACCC02827]|uniref:EcsC family protein n=1 Tax=Bacillaceae TaxID=186817 RepID=UPI0002A4E225|nr:MULTISPECIES: EcsC family protein [Bacillaceae]ELK47664.1 EcsC protein [Halobacillus sp. BAB-2008]QHT45974.1 EcsC family protein [Bacillus sp. SB49]WJE16786.1 EcsC family protein [Halobacillus sp. ACCC02827]
MSYESRVKSEAERWARALEKRPSRLQRSSKRFQTKVNDKIPDNVHKVVTEAVKGMIETALTTSKYIDRVEVDPEWTFAEKEEKVMELRRKYSRSAALEGAGTGLGGFWIGLADFPLLLSIKMKFLFDAGQVYGWQVERYEERLYLLHIFLLAFSSDEARAGVKEKLWKWEELPEEAKQMDWQTLQQEYRDTIDFVKLFQLLPGVGAVVGFAVNGRMLHHLGETAMQCCRLRIL